LEIEIHQVLEIEIHQVLEIEIHQLETLHDEPVDY
jgi:hypothetical protein